MRSLVPLALLLAACDKPEQPPRPAASTAPVPAAPSASAAPAGAPAVPTPSVHPDTGAAPNVRFDPTAPDVPSGEVRAAGTVRRVEVEGGGWVIETLDGTFQPTNLAPAFQQDGLRVTVTLRLRPDLMSTLQVGRLADLVAIARR